MMMIPARQGIYRLWSKQRQWSNPRPSTEARFWAKVTESPSGCWFWAAYKNQDGYGMFRVNGRSVKAHRWAYEHWIGPIPDGLELDHVVCDTPACVNPWHVEPATHRANVQRGQSWAGKNSRKTHCPKGHPYSGDNLYIYPNGGRMCRTCRRERQLTPRYRERRRARRSA